MSSMRFVALVFIAIGVVGCAKGTPATPTVVTPASKSVLDEGHIPTYPGSTSTSQVVSKPAPNGSKRATAEFSTSDSGDKVAQFYKEKLGFMSAAPPGTKLIQLVGKVDTGGFVQILVSPNGAQTRIQYYFLLPPRT